MWKRINLFCSTSNLRAYLKSVAVFSYTLFSYEALISDGLTPSDNNSCWISLFCSNSEKMRIGWAKTKWRTKKISKHRPSFLNKIIYQEKKEKSPRSRSDRWKRSERPFTFSSCAVCLKPASHLLLRWKEQRCSSQLRPPNTHITTTTAVSVCLTRALSTQMSPCVCL